MSTSASARYEEMAYLVALVEAGVFVEALCETCGQQVTWQPLWLMSVAAVINQDCEDACWVTGQGDEILALGGDDSSPIWKCFRCGIGGWLKRLGPDGLAVTLRVPGWTWESGAWLMG